MNAHTPGPWTLVSATGYVGNFEITAAVDTEHAANARLIAAAPELLAALKEYTEWGAMTGSDRDLFDQRFRAAIAKAEGQ